MSWEQANLFANSNGMRLPSEAEWEYACRAGTSTSFHAGPASYQSPEEASAVLTMIAWWVGNPDRCLGDPISCFNRTWPVGTRAPNQLGFHDMLGNVQEWVHDWFGFYSEASQSNPTGPTQPDAMRPYRIYRGGSFVSGLPQSRCAVRRGDIPEFYCEWIGFRVARDP